MQRFCLKEGVDMDLHRYSLHRYSDRFWGISRDSFNSLVMVDEDSVDQEREEALIFFPERETAQGH